MAIALYQWHSHDIVETLDHRTLEKLEEKILIGLCEFYAEHGSKQEKHKDIETGGMYEHKLAVRLGYELDKDGSPPWFIEACKALEVRGYVRRTKRRDDFREMGIWPTVDGLERGYYLTAPWPIPRRTSPTVWPWVRSTSASRR